MKSVLPILALATVAFAAPALACDQHQTHASMKTVEAVPAPAPVIIIEPAAQSNLASEIKADDAMSRPLGAAYEGCSRARKDKTVYLTQ